jgi:hypothetical protein
MAPDPEVQRIKRAAQEDAGFAKMLKFKKGKYFDSDGNELQLGTEFIAQPRGWSKCWIKFRGGTVKDRKLYRMSDVSVTDIPDRQDLDDKDESTWEPGLDGRPADPWVLQSILPLENPTNGELVLFVASSWGGTRCIGTLVNNWARRVATVDDGVPIVQLDVSEFESKKFGKVAAPAFKVTGYGFATMPQHARLDAPNNPQFKEAADKAGAAIQRAIDSNRTKAFDDEIPF